MSLLEVPEGYKPSDVGLIPVDWEVKPLGELVYSVEYGSSAKSCEAGAVPVLRMGNLQSGKIDWDGLVYTSNLDEIEKYRLNKNDVLFNRTNTVDLVGKTSIYKGEHPAIYAGYLIRINRIESLLEADYLNYILNSYHSKKYSKLILSVAVSQANINGQKLKTYPIPIPPNKKEQTAIANALSDVDALITSLEKLIAKKRAIKTAAMQQLLTGKKRLPPFDKTHTGYKQTELGEIPEDWEVATVGGKCDFLTGFPFPSNKYTENGVRLLRGSNVKRGVTDWSEGITQYWPGITPDIRNYELAEKDIVISMDGSLVGRSFAQLSKSDLPAILLQRVARLRSENVEIDYLKEWVCSNYFTEYCDSVKTVTAIPHISPDDIRNFKFPLPPTKKEQKDISNVLSEMHEEIEILEQHLNKTQQLKQGMMQELLTGKTRLL